MGTPSTFDLPSLDGHPGTVKLIPGNHDRFGPPPPGVNHPGSAHFDTVFGSYWGAGCGGVQELWHDTKDGHTLVLIGADLTLAGNDMGNWIPIGWCGQGRAYPPQMSALVRATQKARGHYPGCTVLWMVHFMPFQAPPMLELLNASHLLHAAQAENIPAVLCGHTHQQSGRFPHPTAAGVDFFLCGSTTQYHEPAGNFLNLLDVTFDAPGAAPDIRLHYFQYQFGQFAWAGTV